MINQEIKTKATAAKVARGIKTDVIEAIGFFEGYNVELVSDTNSYEVKITSSSYCVILTDSVLSYLFNLANMFITQYRHVNYSVNLYDGKPAFIYSVYWSEE